VWEASVPSVTLTLLNTSEHNRQRQFELLKEFEARYRITVEVRELQWDSAWTEYSRFATYGEGPDVAQVGTTWISPLAGMNALRPFTMADLAPIGGPGVFQDSIARTGTFGGAIWAVPWLLDTRLIWYWRRALSEAGIPEIGAFENPERMTDTIARLQRAGQPTWAAPTTLTWTTLQNIASWIWAAGGDILGPNDATAVFDQPEALSALKAYFGLARYMAPNTQALDSFGSDLLFAQRRAAVTVAGPWIPDAIAAESSAPESLADLGATPMPGWSWVGGSNLVVWRRSLQVPAALDLVRFLTGYDAQMRLARIGNLLPTRLDVLTDPSLTANPLFRALSTNAQRGRSFPPVKLWGLVETQLSQALAAVWRDVLADPGADLGPILTRHLGPLARRLSTTLAA